MSSLFEHSRRLYGLVFRAEKLAEMQLVPWTNDDLHKLIELAKKGDQRIRELASAAAYELHEISSLFQRKVAVEAFPRDMFPGARQELEAAYHVRWTAAAKALDELATEAQKKNL